MKYKYPAIVLLSLVMLGFGVAGALSSTPNTAQLINIYAADNNCCSGDNCASHGGNWEAGYHDCAAGKCSKCAGGSSSSSCGNGKCESGESENSCPKDCKQGGKSSGASSSSSDSGSSTSGGGCAGPLSAKACAKKNPGDNVQGVCTCQVTTANNCACVGDRSKETNASCSGSSECKSGACRDQKDGNGRVCVPQDTARKIDEAEGDTTIFFPEKHVTPEQDANRLANGRCSGNAEEIGTGPNKGKCACYYDGRVVNKGEPCTGAGTAPSTTDANGETRCIGGSKAIQQNSSQCLCRDSQGEYLVAKGRACNDPVRIRLETDDAVTLACPRNSVRQQDGEQCRCNGTNKIIIAGGYCNPLANEAQAVVQAPVPTLLTNLIGECSPDVNCGDPALRMGCAVQCLLRSGGNSSLEAAILGGTNCTSGIEVCIGGSIIACSEPTGNEPGTFSVQTGRSCSDQEREQTSQLIQGRCAATRLDNKNDVNCDGRFNGADVAIIARTFGQNVVSPALCTVLTGNSICSVLVNSRIVSGIAAGIDTSDISFFQPTPDITPSIQVIPQPTSCGSVTDGSNCQRVSDSCQYRLGGSGEVWEDGVCEMNSDSNSCSCQGARLTRDPNKCSSVAGDTQQCGGQRINDTCLSGGGVCIRDAANTNYESDAGRACACVPVSQQ